MFTFRLPTAADPGHVYNDRDATIMKTQGVTKVAFIGGGNAQSVDFLTRNKQGFKSVGGIPIVYDNENVPAGTSDFTAEAQAIKDSGADGLLTGMDFIPNTSLSAQLVKDGVTMKETAVPRRLRPTGAHVARHGRCVLRPRVQAVRVEPARVHCVRRRDAEGSGAQPGELHRMALG